MQYEVLKTTIIDGKAYNAGETIDGNRHNLTRLELLGFVAPLDDEPVKETRVTAPKRKRRS